MTHKQKWTEIAEAFHTPENEGTGEQRSLARSGLCLAAYCLDRGHWAAFEDYLCGRSFKQAFWLPTTRQTHFSTDHRREYDLIRGDMATLLACMAEKEFNELLAPTGAQQKDK